MEQPSIFTKNYLLPDQLYSVKLYHKKDIIKAYLGSNKVSNIIVYLFIFILFYF